MNPTQFGPREDLARYPRDLERDRALLQAAGCDLLFVPAAGEMYPPGAATAVDVGPVASPLEGERRPGHFRGVATVVLKLLTSSSPTARTSARRTRSSSRSSGAWCATWTCRSRSSAARRSARRTGSRRAAATATSTRTTAGRRPSSTARSPPRARPGSAASAARGVLRDLMTATLAAEPRARVDYVSAADPSSFEELQDATSGPVLLSMAVQVGRARLIDNVLLPALLGPGAPETGQLEFRAPGARGAPLAIVCASKATRSRVLGNATVARFSGRNRPAFDRAPGRPPSSPAAPDAPH